MILADRPGYAYNVEELRDTLVVAEPIRRSMRGNKSVETGPEVALRKELWAAGVRGYRKNVKNLPGRPDVVFGRAKLAVFVHGCFWHGCPHCKRNLTPKLNARFWQAKLEGNRERDARAQEQLRGAGFEVLVIWECRLKEDPQSVVDEIQAVVSARH